MICYKTTAAALFNAVAVLAPALAVATLVTAPVPAQAGARCPDQQMSESGPFQGRICGYGDWEVSQRFRPGGNRYRYRY